MKSVQNLPFTSIDKVHLEPLNHSFVVVTPQGTFRVHHNTPHLAWILQNTPVDKITLFKTHFNRAHIDVVIGYDPPILPENPQQSKIFVGVK